MLEQILQRKREEVETAKARLAPAELQRRVATRTGGRDFRAAIHHTNRVALIAELKRKSPSRGMLRERFDPVSLAQSLEEAGAAALSVLTDEPAFGGQLEFLRDVRQFTEVPTLRKDFILEPYQVLEAALYEADAVLLIVRVLSDEMLRACLEAAQSVGVAALVEVHSPEEVARAQAAGATIIGINARDLGTFEVHPEIVEPIVAAVPAGTTVVAESGIRQAADIQRLKALGVHAVLIGEALMTAPDVSAKVRELFHGTW